VTSPEFGTRIGVNQVTKLAVAPRLELFVQTEPYVHSSNSSGGDKQIHPGEVWLGAQVQQAQYELAQVRRDRIKLKRP
jgi:hypothetical protein